MFYWILLCSEQDIPEGTEKNSNFNLQPLIIWMNKSFY